MKAEFQIGLEHVDVVILKKQFYLDEVCNLHLYMYI